MFKAWDSESQADVISLDFAGEELEDLRRKGRAHVLLCPVCKHPVKVRSSDQVSTHFAHWHLGDCPSSHEPPEVLIARAALYRWLKKKFADGVTLEHRPGEVTLPRAIDGWVEFEGHRIMYWIAPGGMKPDARELLMGAAKALGAHLHVVFLTQVMRRNGAIPGRLNLTTTEREFLAPSRYDVVHDRWGDGSLHYIDGESEKLHTFRAMRCVEKPQRYEGVELATSLDDVLALRANGAFVHPGEHDHLKEHEEREARERERRAAEAREREAREREAAAVAAADELRWRARTEQQREHRQSSVEQQGRPQEHARTMQPQASSSTSASARSRIVRFDSTASTETSRAASPPDVEAARNAPICIFCGKATNDWWLNEGNGTCRCKRCRDRGLWLPLRELG